MSSREFGEWMAFDYLSPGEPERGDWNAAMVAHTIYDAHRTRKMKKYDIKDFLLQFSPKRIVRKTAKDIKMKLLAFKGMMDARKG